MIEPGLHDELVAGVLIVAGRVHPVILPQGTTYPALTYSLVSDPRDQDLEGPTGLIEARYQISAWSTSYSDAKAAADEARVALDGFSGVMGVHEVARIAYEGGVDLFDQNERVHQIETDYKVRYFE